MEDMDALVLRSTRDWLQAAHLVVLATVVRTWGSSPRPVGAMMALRGDGHVVGSVSGGCIEDDLIQRYSGANRAGAVAGRSTELLRYGVTADEAHRFGLPCGGTLELLLEFAPDLAAMDALVARLEGGELVARTVHCADGTVSLASAGAEGEADVLQFDGHTMRNVLGPAWRMLLIGAGALAHYLGTMAQFSGFAVTVCDPRTEYWGGLPLTGVRRLTDMPDDAVTAFAPDRRTCIVALSHDPKLDDMALLEALHSEAFYVGAIGSRKNTESRKERLKTYFGETDQTLARLHGPVGLYIGSKTPAEIAVSIMAEILAVKNGVVLPREMAVEQGKAMAAVPLASA